MIWAVIVTYNRLELLKQLINNLLNQIVPPDRIVVVNNGSTDGTEEWLQSCETIELITQENVGGAGGFHTGVKYAYNNGAEWVWIMDDDILPRADCLQRLLDFKHISTCLNPVHFDYEGKMLDEERWLDPASCAIINMWNISHRNNKPYWFRNIGSFEGMLIARELIDKIGFPDKRFFIAHDDLVYGYLASKHVNVAVISDAVIERQMVVKPAKSAYGYLYYMYRNLWLVEEYVSEDLKGFNGYRRRRVLLQFVYAIYSIMKSKEFKSRPKAIITIFKAFAGYIQKKEGKTFK